MNYIIFSFVIGVIIGILYANHASDGRFIITEKPDGDFSVNLDIDFDICEIRNHKKIVFTIYRVKADTSEDSAKNIH